MPTAQEIFSETLPTKLEGNDKIQDIDSVYQFNITGDDGGSWSIDFTKDTDYVSEGEADDADVVIEMKDADFVDMWEGKLPGPQAFMMGKIKIQGDMGLAMKLQSFMG
ncbi:MAG: SCP2 sterol-binding domain-containing protein [Persicimonas sp.]